MSEPSPRRRPPRRSPWPRRAIIAALVLAIFVIGIALGAAATVIVLIRTISKPDDFFFAGRGVGIWISLIAAVAVIVAGLLQASEEL